MSKVLADGRLRLFVADCNAKVWALVVATRERAILADWWDEHLTKTYAEIGIERPGGDA